MARLADLFTPPPTGWGLRGDPALWAALRDHLADRPLPASRAAVLDDLATAFTALCGHPPDHPDPIPVAAFASATGGLSNGLVSPAFWRDTGFPLILSRLPPEE